MRINRRTGPRDKASAVSKILFIAVIILGFALLGDSLMRPAIESVIAYQTRVLATRQINEAMMEQIERSDLSYDELARVVRGPGGEILSIQADMSQINRLKSSITDSVAKRLEDAGNQDISIPLGTMAGNQLTAGRGPVITVKAVPVGYVQSEIFNRFSSAGINQTLHQIMLRVNVQMVAVMPGYNVKTETETNFCIAETVIVGDVPQVYATGVTPIASG